MFSAAGAFEVSWARHGESLAGMEPRTPPSRKHSSPRKNGRTNAPPLASFYGVISYTVP